MGFFEKKMEPTFLKETSDAKIQLEALKALLLSSDANTKPQIEQKIKILTSCIFGEDHIIYELKNSHIPMYVLQDLYLQDDNLTAQIDFLIITEKVHFVVESKNMIGDIEINKNGDFIRTFTYGGVTKKERIYSPVTQNNRHLELIKKITTKSKGNFISKALFEKSFHAIYQNVVVLANSKTILDANAAPIEIQNQVIHIDRLIDFIKKVNAKSKVHTMRISEMQDLATQFLEWHKVNKTDYIAQLKNSSSEPNTITPKYPPSADEQHLQGSPLYQALKSWRLKKSQLENIKPYLIFYNTTLDELVEKKPGTLQKLGEISGIGMVKCEKYGEEILQIIRNTR